MDSLEETNPLIQYYEEIEMDQLVFNIESSFGEHIGKEINSEGTMIKEWEKPNGNNDDDERKLTDKLEETDLLIQDAK